MNKISQKDQASKASNFIFCDGASKGNPGPGGWATVVVKNDQVQELGGGEKNTTNNRMELTAALRGLECFFSLGDEGSKNVVPSNVTVYTDSSYVINGINKWVSGWKRNGWVTKTKQSVLHRDLWEGISEFQDLNPGKISWVHVKGHSGIPLNERCDEIATGFAEAILDGVQIDAENKIKKTSVEPKLFSGSRSDYKISTDSVTQSISSSAFSSPPSYSSGFGLDNISDSNKSHASKKSRSQAKAFSYVSAVGGKVEVHQDWASCEKRVKGASGARFKKVFSKAEEVELVKEFGKK